ncbi:MAG: hypothetical protein V1644_02850 [Candidatus Micrarchaeota archaeon]
MEEIIRAVRKVFGTGDIYHSSFHNELQVALHDQTKNDFNDSVVAARKMGQLERHLRKKGFELTSRAGTEPGRFTLGIQRPGKEWRSIIVTARPHHVLIYRQTGATPVGSTRSFRVGGVLGKYTETEVKTFRDILAKKVARKKTAKR